MNERNEWELKPIDDVRTEPPFSWIVECGEHFLCRGELEANELICVMESGGWILYPSTDSNDVRPTATGGESGDDGKRASLCAALVRGLITQEDFDRLWPSGYEVSRFGGTIYVDREDKRFTCTAQWRADGYVAERTKSEKARMIAEARATLTATLAKSADPQPVETKGNSADSWSRTTTVRDAENSGETETSRALTDSAEYETQAESGHKTGGLQPLASPLSNLEIRDPDYRSSLSFEARADGSAVVNTTGRGVVIEAGGARQIRDWLNSYLGEDLAEEAAVHAERDSAVGRAAELGDHSGDIGTMAVALAERLGWDGSCCPIDFLEQQTEIGTSSMENGGYRIYQDGDHWCAVGPGFVNLQESAAAFATPPGGAFDMLLSKNPSTMTVQAPDLTASESDMTRLRADFPGFGFSTGWQGVCVAIEPWGCVWLDTAEQMHTALVNLSDRLDAEDAEPWPEQQRPYARVELLGRQVVEGLIQRVEIAGVPMLEVFSPSTDRRQFFGHSAIFRIVGIADDEIPF